METSLESGAGAAGNGGAGGDPSDISIKTAESSKENESSILTDIDSGLSIFGPVATGKALKILVRSYLGQLKGFSMHQNYTADDLGRVNGTPKSTEEFEQLEQEITALFTMQIHQEILENIRCHNLDGGQLGAQETLFHELGENHDRTPCPMIRRGLKENRPVLDQRVDQGPAIEFLDQLSSCFSCVLPDQLQSQANGLLVGSFALFLEKLVDSITGSVGEELRLEGDDGHI